MTIERTETIRFLKVLLTEDERRKLSDEMALAVMQKNEAESELKSAQTQIKSKIAAHDAVLISDAERLRSGFEMRNVACEVEKDFDHMILTITRLDTSEIIEDRKIRPEETQQSMIP